jgi:hypothetical protein
MHEGIAALLVRSAALLIRSPALLPRSAALLARIAAVPTAGRAGSRAESAHAATWLDSTAPPFDLEPSPPHRHVRELPDRVERVCRERIVVMGGTPAAE